MASAEHNQTTVIATLPVEVPSDGVASRANNGRGRGRSTRPPRTEGESSTQSAPRGAGRGGRGGNRGGRGGRGGNTTSRQIIDRDAPQRRRGFVPTFTDYPTVIDQKIVDFIRYFLQFHRAAIQPRVAFMTLLIAHDQTFKPANLSNCSYLLTREDSNYRLTANEACQVSSIYHIMVRRGILAQYSGNRPTDATSGIQFGDMRLGEN